MNDEKTIELTQGQINYYLRNPDHCPLCESSDIDKGKYEYRVSTTIESRNSCNRCGCKWDDSYMLFKVQVIKNGDNDGK